MLWIQKRKRTDISSEILKKLQEIKQQIDNYTKCTCNNYEEVLDAIYDKIILVSQNEFKESMSVLYDKFKHADTTKESQEYLEQMDKLICSHVEFILNIANHVHKAPIKLYNLSQMVSTEHEVGKYRNFDENQEQIEGATNEQNNNNDISSTISNNTV